MPPFILSCNQNRNFQEVDWGDGEVRGNGEDGEKFLLQNLQLPHPRITVKMGCIFQVNYRLVSTQ